MYVSATNSSTNNNHHEPGQSEKAKKANKTKSVKKNFFLSIPFVLLCSTAHSKWYCARS